MKAIRRALLWGINKAGYDLIRPNPNPRGFIAGHLKRFLHPRTVIDVGAAEGTPALLEAFPTARFILIEPVAEYEDCLRALQHKYNCEIHMCAASSAPGTAELNVGLDDAQKSSFSERTQLTRRHHKFRKRRVKVRMLDEIARECGPLERPVLLKLDTEGHELEALMGAEEMLKQVDSIISEVSIARRFDNGYRFEDMVSFMVAHGFRFADVLAVAHAEDELAPHHIDVLYVREQA